MTPCKLFKFENLLLAVASIFTAVSANNQVGCGEMKTSAARSAMADLRMRLRGVSQLEKKSYNHPREIAPLITSDLVAKIRDKYPISTTPTSIERLRIEIESICKAHFHIINTEVNFARAQANDKAVLILLISLMFSLSAVHVSSHELSEWRCWWYHI